MDQINSQSSNKKATNLLPILTSTFPIKVNATIRIVIPLNHIQDFHESKKIVIGLVETPAMYYLFHF